MQDDYVSGVIKFGEFKKKVANVNREAKKRNVPFRMRTFKETAHEVLNLLMTAMPDELVEFDDNNVKNELEGALNPFEHKWGGMYGY